MVMQKIHRDPCNNKHEKVRGDILSFNNGLEQNIVVELKFHHSSLTASIIYFPSLGTRILCSICHSLTLVVQAVSLAEVSQ
jgi:hypothetical protein